MKDMKLGLQLGYWGSGPPAAAPEQVAEAERLGFDSVWTAESYGSDALTPLAWWGARTERVRLGTSLCQLSARTPTAAAMAALTMDHLSGGRFVLGLGVSGPQVVEGWYGQPFARPLARTREYIEIVRKVLARRGPGHQRRPQLPAPLPRRHRTGQAPQADRAPPAGRRADHHGGRGAQEHRPGGRDRRRLVPHLLLAPGHGRLRGLPGRGVRPARGPADARDFEVLAFARPSWPTTSSRRPTPSVPTWPSTSGAWGPRR